MVAAMLTSYQLAEEIARRIRPDVARWLKEAEELIEQHVNTACILAVGAERERAKRAADAAAEALPARAWGWVVGGV